MKKIFLSLLLATFKTTYSQELYEAHLAKTKSRFTLIIASMHSIIASIADASNSGLNVFNK
jgi:hypothetical protein